MRVFLPTLHLQAHNETRNHMILKILKSYMLLSLQHQDSFIVAEHAIVRLISTCTGTDCLKFGVICAINRK